MDVPMIGLDAQTRAALTRLTGNEKDCLRRRLRHQTAKEIALDLGVSRYTIEKRLKMARAKLGVASSLRAARLLEAFERDQPTGAQPSDLASGVMPRKNPLHQPYVIGAMSMSIIAAAAITLVAQTPTAEKHTDAHRASPESARIELVPQSPETKIALHGRKTAGEQHVVLVSRAGEPIATEGHVVLVQAETGK
jgi:DNA-binding CsgD family transcriptional regulator